MTKKNTIYFTVVGLVHHLPDREFIKPDMIVTLEKEPDNDFDKEAIKVLLPGIGQIGYVSANYRTRIGEVAYSAGRLYDQIGDTAEAKVLYNMDTQLQCELIR